jgi:acyl carrier protein
MQALANYVFPVVDEFADTVPNAEKLIKAPETVLLGENAVLDSLNFVSFIAAVEERIENTTGKRVSLANERAMSRQRSPFRTMGSLASYIEELLADRSEA